MAKNKVIELRNQLKETETTRKFKTSRGLEIVLRQIPPYLIQMATQTVEIPEVPTYEVELLGGGKEVHKHDETSIAQSSDEEKQIWKNYKIKVGLAEAKASEILLNMILMEGVIIDLPDPDSFIRHMKVMGITVPEDSEERLLMYKKAYVIGNTSDAQEIIRQVLELTNVSGDLLKQVEDSFPDSVESQS